MNQYHDVYKRLQEYYKMFSNNAENGFVVDDSYYFGMSISRISELTQIPLAVVRKDIVGIRSWKDILEYDDYVEEELSDKLNAALEEDNSVFDELILDGTFDMVPIYFSQKEEARYQIKLHSDEAHAYQNYFSDKHKIITPNYDSSYQIKDSYRYYYIDKLIEKLEYINNAIQTDRCIRINYSPAQGDNFTATIKPLKIVYDSMDNIYAILTIIDQQVHVYRLDRINDITESYMNITIEDTTILSIAPNVWGCTFNDSAYQVKVRFYDEGNVWNKVRQDLSCRINGRLYEQDGFLYYEDIVYGISAFRNWIYGYGSSAIVLEPKVLREQIIESLKLRELG